MSRRVGRRALALGSLAAAFAAGAAAVLSGLGAPSATVTPAKAAPPAGLGSRSVAFGNGRVVLIMRTSSLGCFRVTLGSSTVARSCVSTSLGPTEIAYASSRYAVGGVAGSNVRAVIVRLTKKGTVWATMRRGTFYAAVPAKHNVRAVVKVLSDGSRTSFTVTGSR
ncbi:MAG TPA: hypothetical protein VNR59_03260 [Gaiellaceae bacterium]|nr:hypothetical protein [Gaiellaceae bacterium]